MKRSAPLRRTAHVRTRNPERRTSEFARCYGSKDRVAWVKSLGCCIKALAFTHVPPIDNAHIRGAGAGRKAGYQTIIPLCRHHHEVLHHMGPRGFEEGYLVDLAALAARTEEGWQAHVARSRSIPHPVTRSMDE